ncbi:MAG: type II toxin-antitoxin system RelE/ParE family toxin [Xanthomonadales bacterium]|nr:type II toxin-antitoxin system RelE/ParE family toxin [Xanthomonadales bacterium]
MVRIRWTTPAAKALLAIQAYIARDNPRAAFECAQHIRVAVEQLIDHPRMERKGRVRGTWELVIHGKPHIVAYQIKSREVQILTVYHTSRKWPESFE